ncbi:hypothetical protein IQ268_11085 [Oculatella sp. LEGE 06141]|uniref:hypothetical protein n=1 Tax=Oculatella sp. LEGE 06141 TaxID=1828648 RepID=UPI0018808CD3|nr:hypothetical protein [Oculatella sp. LEGE 06141]MBE9179105.1 hypothetical protein [Oculatella sp. LEGE 06141]
MSNVDGFVEPEQLTDYLQRIERFVKNDILPNFPNCSLEELIAVAIVLEQLATHFRSTARNQKAMQQRNQAGKPE